jgi:hypothetical protein
MAKTGPKPLWNAEIEDHIIGQMGNHGRSLKVICRDDPGMPCLMTVMRELDRNPEFVTRYARAREMMAEHAASDMMEVAAKSTAESAPADRVKLMAMQWYASKLRPRVYGVDAKTTITGPNDGPIQIAAVTVDATDLGEDQRDALRAALLAAAAPR